MEFRMFTKPWFRCGLAVGASFLAVGAVAASANNGYVEVSSSTPGVVEVVPVGMDFHITTANVSDAFKANVAVNPAPGWNLISPNPASFEMTVGGSKGYEVRSQSNEEDKAGGNIFLFKVDVEIDGVGEDKEETEGAFVGYADCANGFDPACVAAMKPVKIRCLPAGRPDDEKIDLTFPSGHLLEKVGTTYQAAQSSYKANEIGGKSFWLHGHAASGTLCDDAIKAEHSVNRCKDEAKYTVFSAAIDWETIDSALDGNPNWNGGKRIFPDKPSYADTTARDKVRLRAKLTPALPNIQLFVKAFDVDDPTPPSIDPNGVIDSNGQSGNDNRGAPSTGTLSATSGTTDANGEVVVTFIVTKQPGDNFRAAVALDQAELNKLTVTDPNSSSYVKPDNSVPVNFCGGLSPMLTVWRRLWLEFDSMGTWPSSGDDKNFETGSITGIQSNTPTSGQSTLQLDLRLLDEEDRYENGFIQIAGVGCLAVNSNTDNLLFDDTVVIDGVPPQSVVSLSFLLYDDDNVQRGSRLPRTMPYTLSGGALIDSAFSDAFIKPAPVPSIYIDVDVPFKRNLDAGLGYYSGWLPAVNHSRDLEESTDFWYSYVLAAFQPEVSQDNDPSTQGSLTFGQTDPGMLPKNRSTIYVETLREVEVLPATPRIREEHTVVHEIGHQGGGTHGDGGIMADHAPIDQVKFAPATIDKFRNNINF